MNHTPHTIAAAMNRGELTEEEAYFVLRFAGRHGYDKAIRRLRFGLLRGIRRWFIWVGGWETTELRQWDEGLPAWRFKYGPTPVSLFGHRITFYAWGMDVRLRRRHLCWTWNRRLGRKLYLSPDATPSNPSAVWLWPRRKPALP